MALSGSLTRLLQGESLGGFLAAAAAVFFPVYLPLCVYRKTRIAKTVAGLMREHMKKAEAQKDAAG